MRGFLSRPGILNSWLEVVRSCSGCFSSYCLGMLFFLPLLMWQNNSNTLHFGRQKSPLQQAKEISISSLFPTVAMKSCIYISCIFFSFKYAFPLERGSSGTLNLPGFRGWCYQSPWIYRDCALPSSSQHSPCRRNKASPIFPVVPHPSELLLSWHKWAAPPLAILWAWKPQSSKGEQSRRAVLIVLSRGSFRSLPVFIKA